MPDPTLRQLRTFLAVAASGSVSAAARQLGLTQPEASQQLRELERSLRVRLFERAGAGSTLTAVGEALLGPAQRAQAAIEDAHSVASSYRTGEVGRVRLGTGATACIYLVPRVLATARERMPGLDVIVATGNSSAIVDRVESGELDLALVTLPVAAGPGLSVTKLLSDPLLALIPQPMAIAGDNADAAQLTALPLILYEPSGGTRALIDGWFRAAGITPSPIMQLDSVEAIKVLVGGGLGASILPGLSLMAPVAGAVVRRLRPPAQRVLGVVLRREKVMDRGLRVMMEALHSCT